MLSEELIITIFNNLDHEGLIKMYKLDTKYQSIIKNNVWQNITIKFLKNKRIQKFVNDGWINCFVKYELAGSEINNEYIKYFTHCSTLDLYKCYNLDTGCTKYLSNCHTIDLSHNYKIEDSDIKYLSNCHTVRLAQCTYLTDKCTEYLKNCYEVDLDFCNITDEGVINLTNCKIVRVGHTRITRNCIKYLTNCIELNISESDIIDNDMMLLENIQNLNISYCKNISNECIQYLKSIKILNVEMTNISLEYINKNFRFIELNRSIPLNKLDPEEQ
jgi:hypothetical protein